jgi:hypothetical protein
MVREGEGGEENKVGRRGEGTPAIRGDAMATFRAPYPESHSRLPGPRPDSPQAIPMSNSFI